MDLELFIKKVPLFSSIPESQIQDIAACFNVRNYQKDDVIFRQGDKSEPIK